MEDYDTDRMFPALGFGAKVPPGMSVSHEFFLNLRQDSPFCAGVQGLLEVTIDLMLALVSAATYNRSAILV